MGVPARSARRVTAGRTKAVLLEALRPQAVAAAVPVEGLHHRRQTAPASPSNWARISTGLSATWIRTRALAGVGAAARAVLGDANDGPRLDALVRLPAGRGQIADLAGRAERVLDRLRGPIREIAGDLAALGVVIELAQANLWLRDPPRVAAWRGRFDACEQASTGDPSTWEARVRSGFDLLD